MPKDYEKSSGNIFADLGFPDSREVGDALYIFIFG